MKKEYNLSALLNSNEYNVNDHYQCKAHRGVGHDAEGWEEITGIRMQGAKTAPFLFGEHKALVGCY